MWEFQVKGCTETALHDEQRRCHGKKGGTSEGSAD